MFVLYTIALVLGLFSSPSYSLAAITGTQPTLVLLVQFTNSAPPPWGVSEVTSLMFTSPTSVKAFYSETSHGLFTLSGDVHGWYTINFTQPTNVLSCNAAAYEAAANTAASNDGVNLSAYTHTVYVLAPGAVCGENAPIGGNTAVISGVLDPHDYAHELGHNLGLNHATSIDCVTVQIKEFGGCTSTDYSDNSDVMGGPLYVQFNAPHKIFLGWINTSNIQNVVQSGTYTVSPLESNTGATVLAIARPDVAQTYYVSYRQPTGFDAPLAGSEFVQGVAVHLGTRTTDLIDTTPGDQDRTNDTLLDGQSFGDPFNGINITQVSHSSTGAVVSVTFSCPFVDTIKPMSVGFSPSSGYVGRSAPVNLTAADDVGVTKVEVYQDGSLLTTINSPPFAFTWDTTGFVNLSTHTLQAKAYDAVNNVGISSIDSYTIDNTNPTVSISTPTNSATVSGNVSIGIAGNDDVAIGFGAILVDGTNALFGGGCCSPGPTSTSTTWNSALTSDGSHTIVAQYQDEANNIGTATINVTTNNGVHDTTPPTVSITSPSGTTDTNGFVQVRYTASDNVGLGKLELLTPFGTILATNGPPYPIPNGASSALWPITNVVDNSYNVQMRATDTSGNVTTSSAISVTIVGGIDNVPPTQPGAPSNVVTGHQVAVTWGFSTDNIGVVGYRVLRNGVGAIFGVNNCCSYTDPYLVAGSYTYSVAAYDAAGNFSTESASTTATVSGPTIGLSPSSFSVACNASPGTVVGTATLSSAPAGSTTWSLSGSPNFVLSAPGVSSVSVLVAATPSGHCSSTLPITIQAYNPSQPSLPTAGIPTTVSVGP